MGVWSKNRLHFGTISGKSSTSSKNVSTGILASDKGGGIYVEEGSHPKNVWEKRSILEQPVFSWKKGMMEQTCDKLKKSECIHSLSPLQNGRLAFAEDMLKEKNYMCKIDLKDAYFCVLLHQKHRKYIWFCWEGQLHEFLCLCFGLGPAPRIFTKLLKIPIAILRRINMRIIVYLDNMLLIKQSTTQKLEFLGLEISQHD